MKSIKHLLREARAYGQRLATPSFPLVRWRARLAVKRMRPGLLGTRATVLNFDEVSSREFSELAASLADFDRHLAAAGAAAAQLENVLQDKGRAGAYASAFDLYKKSVERAQASLGIGLTQVEEMKQLEANLSVNRSQFIQSSFMFRMLVLSVRTEAARIDAENQSVFIAVAGQMAHMEAQMSATVTTAFSELEAITKDAALSREGLVAAQTDLSAQSTRNTKTLESEMERMQVLLEPCGVANSHIVQLLDQTRGLTDQLIVALQYQDIVRQQLEHVVSGFEDLADHLRPDKATSAIDLCYLAQAARVQNAHLAGSRQSIERAGQEIGQTGATLWEVGGKLIGRFSEMAQIATRVMQNSTLAELFEAETSNLVEVANKNEASHDRISGLLDRIERTVEVFSSDIRHHEFEVQLVALNAQVAAARIPNAHALNKLAEETAHVSAGTARLTQAMSQQLAATLDRLRAMRVEADQVRSIIAREKSDLGSGADLVRQKLAELNAHIQQGALKVAADFDAPYRLVGGKLQHLSFPAAIAGAYAPAEEICQRLLTITEPYVGGTLGSEGSASLADHRARYTMQAERDVHSTLTDPNAAVSAEAAVTTVELFDDPPVAEAVPEAASVPPSEQSGERVEAAAKPIEGVELF